MAMGFGAAETTVRPMDRREKAKDTSVVMILLSIPQWRVSSGEDFSLKAKI